MGEGGGARSRGLEYSDMPDDLKIVLLTMLGMSVVTAFHVGQWVRTTILTAVRRSHCLCIACGYNLRGNPSSRCPECGLRREA